MSIRPQDLETIFEIIQSLAGVIVGPTLALASQEPLLRRSAWLDLLLSPSEMNPEQAKEISLSYLKGVFSSHFSS